LRLRELLAEAVSGVPQAAAGRCVHERTSVATCQHCVVACPRDAWQIEEEELMIDLAQCDGCGVCVAVCPEGVLSQPGVSPGSYAGAAELRLSCERVKAHPGEWQLRCVNAVGLARLASLYGSGLRQLVLHVEDCEGCVRGTGQGLTHSLEQLNAVLAQRNMPPIAVDTSPAEPRSCGSNAPVSLQGGPDLSRRGFLRRMVSIPSESEPDHRETALMPAGSYLPPADKGDLALFVPEIDTQRCNGCDACLRVCGHAALTGERGLSDTYVIDADRCTGCGLCSDICDQDAVRVGRVTAVRQTRIAFAVGKCRVCGIRFHKPDTGGDVDNLCQVCSRVNHKRNLYQVL